MRENGVLLPVFSLPSKFGIGCFSKEAYEFIDKMKRAGQKKWQILPLGPTGYGDSPYQSFSTFAGNPYYIDLETLIEEGLLTESECYEYPFGFAEDRIDYEALYKSRFLVLKKAYRRFVKNEDYKTFVSENEEWLPDYCMYMAIKDSFGGISWTQWPDGYKDRDEKTMESVRKEMKEEIDFYSFQQYQFARQWNKLHAYAKEKGIEIIGDIPIYVALDSADTWANPKLFQFNEENMPIAVAGCPPDGFSPTGQLWGNPVYNWEYHKKTGYAWWLKRIQYCFHLYDVVRIDHFRGFDEYYAIPYGEKTAVNGKWMPGPGIELFRVIDAKLGKLNIIAEDLGFLTPSVLKLLEDTGYPGMKVLQFAFDSRESSTYLPYTYQPNSVVYTGTHDNDTTKNWYLEAWTDCREFAKEYMHKENLSSDDVAWDFIALAMGSVSKLCIIPIQDFLCLGKEGRINTPSTLGNNWIWRLKRGQIDDKLIERMYRMTKVYGRI